ncbi:hypothetical protein PVAP13_2NG051200 [Panicum virgatum]|uniref:Uncharacterized protein n=1 Tax=Panicum virgatum TaxID=38727 RepID=A0A8T0V6B2_PANVG|nr:hypothetical protein PVAP13_2NG051200 [Panicum virgatum]
MHHVDWKPTGGKKKKSRLCTPDYRQSGTKSPPPCNQPRIPTPRTQTPTQIPPPARPAAAPRRPRPRRGAAESARARLAGSRFPANGRPPRRPIAREPAPPNATQRPKKKFKKRENKADAAGAEIGCAGEGGDAGAYIGGRRRGWSAEEDAGFVASVGGGRGGGERGAEAGRHEDCCGGWQLLAPPPPLAFGFGTRRRRVARGASHGVE